MGFVAWIVVGLVAGWLAGQLMKGGGYGVVVDIILGSSGRCRWWLAVRVAGSFERWWNDRFYHCCIYRCGDSGGNYSRAEEGLTKMTTKL